MTLPTTGVISLSQVRTELGLSGAISLGQANVRALAGKASGPISLGDLRGKSAATNLTATMTIRSFYQEYPNNLGTCTWAGFANNVVEPLYSATINTGGLTPVAHPSLGNITGLMWWWEDVEDTYGLSLWYSTAVTRAINVVLDGKSHTFPAVSTANRFRQLILTPAQYSLLVTESSTRAIVIN